MWPKYVETTLWRFILIVFNCNNNNNNNNIREMWVHSCPYYFRPDMFPYFEGGGICDVSLSC